MTQQICNAYNEAYTQKTQARRKDLESGQANAQICSLDDHYPIQLLDDLYHITVSLEKVVRLLPDQPDRFRRP